MGAFMKLISLFCGLAFLLPHLLGAQEAAPKPKLRVVTRVVPPFVMEQDGLYSGYTIDLWRRIAQELGAESEFVKVETVPQMLEALEQGKVDVAAAALSITAEREQRIDFTHAFYQSGLQIMVNAQQSGSGVAAWKGLFTRDVWKVLAFLLAALLVNSHVLWLLERKRNAESFPEGYFAGIWEAAWWSVCTIITGGCENKAPLGVSGRIVAVVWMLAGVGLFSYVTATITSTMTVQTLHSDVRGVQDLRGKQVGSVGGSTAERYLEGQGVGIVPFQKIEDACAALGRGELKAVVYDGPILRYYLSSHTADGLALVGEQFDKQSYGIGLPSGSPLRKKINETLLTLSEQGYNEELDRKWFGAE